MSDTTPEMAAEFRRRIMALSPGERVAMACRMFTTARTIARAAILKDGPLPEAEVRRQLFLRFYGNDFSEEERSKIVVRLGTA